MIDVQRARRETPGTEHVVHLNNAGAALMPQPVVDAVADHLALETAIGGYEAADARQERTDRAYDAVAALVGAARDEIAIVENATRAWDMAFYALELGPGDRILTARAEYVSNYLAFLQVTRRTGAVIDVVPDDEHGQLSIAALEQMLDERVKLVAITHVPTNGGLVNPAAEVGRLARAAGATYLLDACQSIGQLPIDVGAIGCDLLAATGRKFLRAPRGTGFLYARRELADRLHPPFVDVRSATWDDVGSYTLQPGARRFETWEGNHATRIALGVAADYTRGWGLPAIRDHVVALAERLRTRLREHVDAEILDLGRERCAIVSFRVPGLDPAPTCDALRRRGINVSLIEAADTRLDMDRRGIDTAIRASVHYFNDDGDVEALVGALAALR